MEKNINLEVSRLLELRKEILRHDDLYNKGTPEITDTEYDNLYLELVSLEESNPDYYDENSPTQKITPETDVIGTGEKVKHTVPMLSQEKAKTEEAIRKFCKRADISKGIVVSWKLDGLTVVTRYKNGIPYLFATRGNGEEGEVITNSCKECFNKKVPYEFDFETRGEAVIPYERFKEVNVNGEYKSPRNLVSGSVRAHDSAVAKDRGMKIITFDTIFADGKDFELDTERFEWLQSLGIETVPYEIFYNIDDLVEYCLSFNEKIRPMVPVQLDGLILAYNDLSIREKLGYTSKHPKGSIAFKFESQDATTILREVVWQVGKTGTITPVANFDPVDIDGATISKASLANLSNIKLRDIMLYDKVLVQKANDIIPQIVSSYSEDRDGTQVEIEIPKHCPSCNHKTIFDGVSVLCESPNCPDQLERKLQHFVSVNAMNIDGLGKKTVAFLLEEGYVNSISDVFRLEESQLRIEEINELVGIVNAFKDSFSEPSDSNLSRIEELDKELEEIKLTCPEWERLKDKPLSETKGFGERKINKMYEGIELAKKQPLNRVLYSLSIPTVGQSVSKVLTERYTDIETLLDKVKDVENFKKELLSIDDFGEIICSNIIHFLQNEKDFLLELKGLGLTMVSDVVKKTANDNITGKSFVVTGTVNHFKNRKELQAKIEELGGKVVGSVSKNTDYLINNDVESNSGKNKKAKELNVPILSEEDFLNMI